MIHNSQREGPASIAFLKCADASTALEPIHVISQVAHGVTSSHQSRKSKAGFPGSRIPKQSRSNPVPVRRKVLRVPLKRIQQSKPQGRAVYC